MSTRHSTRPRRIDDALSQLVDSLTPPLTLSSLGIQDEADLADDPEEILAASEERRHHDNLQRAWHVLDAHATPTNDLNSPIGPAGYGIHRRGSLAGENINNASDLIKRKLLRENASPDKAVRFSNLYSRLLTQPVLSQKWAILFLLYRLSGSEGEGEGEEDGGLMMDGEDVEMMEREREGEGEGRSRSPLMDAGNLPNLLLKGQQQRVRGNGSDEEGPAVSSSASQRPPPASTRLERNNSSVRRPEWERDGEQDYEKAQPRPSRSRANTGPRENPMMEEQKAPFSPQLPPEKEQQKLAKPPEYGLLRELPYNLQGLSSSNLEFSSSSTLKLPPTLPIPIISLLNSLAEPCLLYRGLSSFVDSSDGGLLSQSLRAALSNELRSYLGLVATLEGEIRRALAAPGSFNEPGGVLKGGVTLKRCVVWTRDATMALRLMSLIVEEAQSKF